METRYIVLITILLFLAYLVCVGVVLYRVYKKDTHMKDKNAQDCTNNNATGKTDGSACGYFDTKMKTCLAGTIQNGSCKANDDMVLKVFGVLAGILLLSAIIFPIVMVLKGKKSVQVTPTPQAGTIRFSYF